MVFIILLYFAFKIKSGEFILCWYIIIIMGKGDGKSRATRRASKVKQKASISTVLPKPDEPSLKSSLKTPGSKRRQSHSIRFNPLQATYFVKVYNYDIEYQKKNHEPFFQTTSSKDSAITERISEDWFKNRVKGPNKISAKNANLMWENGWTVTQLRDKDVWFTKDNVVLVLKYATSVLAVAAFATASAYYNNGVGITKRKSKGKTRANKTRANKTRAKR